MPKLNEVARVIGYAQAGGDPKIMGIGPVPAIALGHPIGGTGARITTTGMGLSMIVERV